MEYLRKSKSVNQLAALTLFFLVIIPVYLAVITLPVMYYRTFVGEIVLGSPLMIGLIAFGFVLLPLIEIGPSDRVLAFFDKGSSSDEKSDV